MCTRKDTLSVMEIVNKTALCVIGLGIYPPWIDILESGQQNTWLSNPRPDSIQILHAHGRPLIKLGGSFDRIHEGFRWRSKISNRLLRIFDSIILFPFIFHIPSWKFGTGLKVKDPTVVINTPDTIVTLRWKELGFFNYFLQNSSSDFLVTTTNSSYINLGNLQKLLNSLPGHSLYYGAEPFENAGFVSGSFRIFSRDTVELIVRQRMFWGAALLEDVSLGRLLKKNGIDPVFQPICTFDSEESVREAPCKELESQVHFRLKSGGYENRQDVRLMKLLHSRIKLCAEGITDLKEIV